MKLIDAYASLRELNQPVLQTKDVAAYFNIGVNHANKLLARISDEKQIIRIKQGVWVFPDIEPLLLPCVLTDPFPSYISLQSALYYHGMISQIPNYIYAVSLSRTRVYQTIITNVSTYHMHPLFFFGYEEVNNNELLKIATPEKALLDMFYLSQAKTRLFSTLSEVVLPDNFNLSVVHKMIDKITSIGKKTLVKKHFEEFLERN